MVIAYVENTDNLTRGHIAKKAAEYGLVKRVAEPNEISQYFSTHDTGIESINQLMDFYVSDLERAMDNKGLIGVQRPAFLAAEALGTDISQSLSWAVGNAVFSTGNTSQAKTTKNGYQLIMTLDELEERVRVAVDKADFSDDIFHKEEFGDWLKKSVSLSLRTSMHEVHPPRFYLFDKIYAELKYKDNLTVGPIIKFA